MDVPVFFDHNFLGYKSEKEICGLRRKAYELAAAKQRDIESEHMVYGYSTYDDNGNKTIVRLYSGVPKTESEFDIIAQIPNSMIDAIHKRR